MAEDAVHLFLSICWKSEQQQVADWDVSGSKLRHLRGEVVCGFGNQPKKLVEVKPYEVFRVNNSSSRGCSSSGFHPQRAVLCHLFVELHAQALAKLAVGGTIPCLVFTVTGPPFCATWTSTWPSHRARTWVSWLGHFFAVIMEPSNLGNRE